MLRATSQLRNYRLEAMDGEIGRCKDFLFADDDWVMRYMVADTGGWMPERPILLSPIALDQPDWSSNRFPVRLTKEQIEQAPTIDEDAPVSRQYELELAMHHGYYPYWGGVGVWGDGASPASLYGKMLAGSKNAESVRLQGDPHLRSVNEVTGYHIEARDGEVGHVEDFIIDDETWLIRHLIIDTRNWLPSPKVIVPPGWIDTVSWTDRKVSVPVDRERIEGAPKYDPAAPVNREYETRLYDYYGRPYYW